MNTPIRRLFGVIVLMFVALMGSTTWWTVVRAEELNGSEYTALNNRDLLRGIKIRRGTIRARDGSTIARSTRGADGVYTRRYPGEATFGHPIGYAFPNAGQTELEAFYNAQLSGGASTADALLDQLVGSRDEGDDLRTGLDPGAQALAMRLLAQAGPADGGAAVVLDPRDGAVRVMASVPGYDPNVVRRPSALRALNRDEERPLVNRAVQFGYAPGSSFKVVTLVAALDSGELEPTSTVDGTNNVPISGVPLPNDFNQSFGQIDLTTALAKSVNTSFAQIAERVGKETMRKYMRRFGFDRKPNIDLPANQLSAAGNYYEGRLVPATSRFVDVGRMGIGQDKLQVPPLQMALVAAAVANDGVLMRPHIGDRFVDADGRTSETIEPREERRVMSRETAEAVTRMMVAVVEQGTGTAAQVPGIEVAGKTGTAEVTTGTGQRNNLWFIGFAPADSPEVAFAVTLKGVVGFGGGVAAPIARQLIEELVK